MLKSALPSPFSANAVVRNQIGAGIDNEGGVGTAVREGSA
jgi:hypothetical protein